MTTATAPQLVTHRRNEWVRPAKGTKDKIPGHAKEGAWAGWSIHCFGRPDVPASHGDTQEAAVLRNVDRYHAGQGWGGLGYNFVIFDSGRLWEARGWSHTGAHTAGWNSKRVGVCFAINGDAHFPTDDAWATLAGLVIIGETNGLVVPGGPIEPHRKHRKGKSCPGTKVTNAKLAGLRKWVDGIERG